MEDLRKTREDLQTPHDCHAAYLYPAAGTDLAAIEPFTAELTSIVDLMKEELANEARLLEGTDVPEYNQNELSQPETKRGQWTTDLQTGFLTIVPTPISPPESNTLSSTARPNSPVSPLELFDARFSPSSTGSCSGKEADCGCVIDATNECSVCTVPTTSELTRGMPSDPN
jgi:hypothetical protein